MSIEEKAERAATWLYWRMALRGEFKNVLEELSTDLRWFLWQYHMNLCDRLEARSTEETLH